jgi:hypothetical protein
VRTPSTYSKRGRLKGRPQIEFAWLAFIARARPASVTLNVTLSARPLQNVFILGFRIGLFTESLDISFGMGKSIFSI